MMKSNKSSRQEAYVFYKTNETQKVSAAFALSITIPLLIAIGYALGFIPDTLDKAFITSTYNLPIEEFIPEKAETLQYLVLSVLFPILFCILYRIFSERKCTSGRMISDWSSILYPTELGVICTVSAWSIIGNFKGIQGFSSSINKLFTIIIGVVVVLWALLLAGLSVQYEENPSVRRHIRYPALLIGAVGAFSVIWLYTADNFFINSYTLHHFDAYYYPVFEVFNGKTLLSDFTSLYGFYPYFLAPIFKLLGGISLLRFGIIVGILVLINVLALGLSIIINVKNKVIATVGFIAILFTPCLSSIILSSGFYLQYFPHRTLFPSLLILVCSLWLKTQRVSYRRILTVAGYALCALSLIWNIDSGVVVAAGWGLFRMYDVFSSYTVKEGKLYTGCLKIAGFTILSILSALLTVLLITFFRTGHAVAVSDMIAGQILFKGTGYYMLPMTLQHPWIILAIVYMAGLVKSIGGLPLLRKSEKRNPDSRRSMYFILAILGVGLFSYYQGRSHKDVFPAVIWPGVLLVILFAEEYAVKISQHRKIQHNTGMIKKPMFFADVAKLILTIGLLITLQVSFTVIDFKDSVNIFTLKTSSFPNSQQGNMENRLNYIRQNSVDTAQVDILTLYFAEYYTMLNVKNPMPIRSVVDWFKKEDYQKVIDYLKISRHQLFMDKRVYTLLMSYVPEEFTEVLKNRYTLLDTYDTIKYYGLVQ